MSDDAVRRMRDWSAANHRMTVSDHLDVLAVIARIEALEAETAELRALIEDFVVDPGDCYFDHHGYCQAHNWFETDPACPHARAKALRAGSTTPLEPGGDA